MLINNNTFIIQHWSWEWTTRNESKPIRFDFKSLFLSLKFILFVAFLC